MQKFLTLQFYNTANIIVKYMNLCTYGGDGFI